MASFRLNIKMGPSMAALLCAFAWGCGDNAVQSNNGPTNGAGSSVGGGGAAPTGGAGGTTASGGSGGTSVSGGSGGSTNGAGAAGIAGAAGTTAGAGGALACPATGTQSDPGTAGDGKAQMDAPYVPAPETLMHLNNAPKGKLNGVEVGMPTMPLVYAGKTAYPGVGQMLKYEYWIYVPAQYKPGCPAALAVFQDGLHFVGIDDANLNTPTVLDNLIASGDIPVTIGLFINPGEPGDGHYDGHETPIRSAQYDKNNDTYVSFLLNEFLPTNVLSKYDIVTDPDGWEIGGHSSGGIAAFMAGWYRPDKFRKLLTLDASFPNTQDNNGISLLDDINQSAVKPLRTYLMSGPNDLGGWYPANTQAAMELGAKGYHYQYKVETSTHYPPLAAVTDYANAMRWMWRGYRL